MYVHGNYGKGPKLPESTLGAFFYFMLLRSFLNDENENVLNFYYNLTAAYNVLIKTCVPRDYPKLQIIDGLYKDLRRNCIISAM